jgi:hypothetical protein
MVSTKSIEKEAENLYIKRLKQKDIEASSDANLDCEVLDLSNKYFKIGKPPFYAKIKCRGSETNKYNPQGHPSEDFKDIQNEVIRLKNREETSLYVIAAFYKNKNIKEMNYYRVF